MVSEERQANGRQLFKLFYTDPAEPIETRFQLHHFDNGNGAGVGLQNGNRMRPFVNRK